MKLRPISDIHLEFLGDYHSLPANNGRDWNSYTILPKMPDEKEQTLVLAGDIIMLKYMQTYIPFFRDISSRFKEILIVAGNHEFYRYNFITGYQDYRNFLADFDNIRFLQDDVIEIENYAIFGATLWTDFNKRNPFSMGYATTAMSDFKVIEYTAQDAHVKMLWTPDQSVSEHEKTLIYMKQFFDTYKDKKKIVLTHHLPSEQCGSPRFKGSKLNPAFSSSLDELIYEHKPALWIYGHTHDSGDFMIGDTRMLCNPRGYPEEIGCTFNSTLIIEI